MAGSTDLNPDPGFEESIPLTPDQEVTEQPSRSPSRGQAIAGLAIAAAILVGAWFVAGSAGLDSVGQGGINQQLLPKVGEEAPDFTAVALNGDIVSLSDFRGQPVWINFWGAWCPPCRAEMPDIQTAYEELGPQGLVLLAVSLGDRPSEAADFARKNDVTFTVLVDPDRTLTSKPYPIYNFPTHIFVDEDGIVRNIVLSEMSSDQAIAAAGTIMPEVAQALKDEA
jgi:cytochrome c biogenesis protein CcmG, thiol:disulfide interchange protein DsbE